MTLAGDKKGFSKGVRSQSLFITHNLDFPLNRSIRINEEGWALRHVFYLDPGQSRTILISL